jgi:lipopolysaccharide transport system ATP-binding protein
MSNIAIKVENLSKSYILGHNIEKERYASLRDVISRNAKSIRRKTLDMFTGKAIVQGDELEEYWALKNINFEIKQGERIGIIGRNGAGKSTLLKMLSQITEPTTGRIKMNGRVASLLEVGTGFHPELTGRENIFLNAAILGMSRSDVQLKFDEIVEFAEVERFLDTPVKRYSSGMYVRLAFAVAAHLEPEILIVDEVLAVGDAQFQQKCLGKLEDISSNGRTVLFVSHNMSTVQALCNRCLLLSRGELVEDGLPQNVVLSYIDQGRKTSSIGIESREDREGDGSMMVIGLELGLVKKDVMGFWVCGEDVYLDMLYRTLKNETLNNIEIAFVIRKLDDTPLLYFGTKITHQGIEKLTNEGRSRCVIPKLPVEPGKYLLTIELKQNGVIADLVRGVKEIEVHEGDYYGTGSYWPYGGTLCYYDWQHSNV